MPGFLKAATAATMLWLLTACAITPHADNTGVVGYKLQQLPPDTRHDEVRSRPLLAVVLGGGGLRGYAHIGVLQALEEAGIHPDIVVGTSIGAVVGAAYAAGMTPAQLWKQANSKSLLSLADFTLIGPGLVRGQALARWTDELVGYVPIERFPMRFAAVATDLDRSAPVAIISGDAGQAVRASAAIPGVFLPVMYSGGELVDGGVTSLVPVQTAKALGANSIIAVDIYCRGAKYPTDSVMSTLLRVSQTQSCLLAENELAGADVLIAPPVVTASLSDAAAREQARAIGYAAATAALPAIEVLLRRSASVDAWVNIDSLMSLFRPYR